MSTHTHIDSGILVTLIQPDTDYVTTNDAGQLSDIVTVRDDESQALHLITVQELLDEYTPIPQ